MLCLCRHSNYLLEENNDDAVPFCVATGNVETLVHFFCGKGQMQDAMTVATAAYEGSIGLPTLNNARRGSNANGLQEAGDNVRYYMCSDERKIV